MAVPFSMFIEPRARSTSASSGEIAVGGAKPTALGCAPGTGDRPVGDAPTIPAMASATSEAPAGAARRRFECVDRVCSMLPPFRVEDRALSDWSSARSRAGRTARTETLYAGGRCSTPLFRNSTAHSWTAYGTLKLLDQYRLEAVGPKIGSMQGDVPHPYGSSRIVSSSCGSLEPHV